MDEDGPLKTVASAAVLVLLLCLLGCSSGDPEPVQGSNPIAEQSATHLSPEMEQKMKDRESSSGGFRKGG